MNKPCFIVHFEKIKADQLVYRRMGIPTGIRITSDVGDSIDTKTVSCPVIDYQAHKFRSPDGNTMYLYFAKPLPDAILQMIHKEALLEAESYKHQKFLQWFFSMPMEKRKAFVATILGWGSVPINDLPNTIFDCEATP